MPPELRAWFAEHTGGQAPGSRLAPDRTCRHELGGRALGLYRVGEKVTLSCSNGVATGITPAREWAQSTVARLTPIEIALGSTCPGAPPPSPTCTRGPHSPAAGGYGVGERVRIECVGSVLTAIGPPHGPNGGGGTSFQSSFRPTG